MTACQYCGEAAEETYRLSMEWPAEEPRDDEPVTFDDPGAGELTLCEECADAVASNVFVGRAVHRDLGDMYAGLEPESSAGGGVVADD